MAKRIGQASLIAHGQAAARGLGQNAICIHSKKAFVAFALCFHPGVLHMPRRHYHTIPAAALFIYELHAMQCVVVVDAIIAYDVSGPCTLAVTVTALSLHARSCSSPKKLSRYKMVSLASGSQASTPALMPSASAEPQAAQPGNWCRLHEPVFSWKTAVMLHTPRCLFRAMHPSSAMPHHFQHHHRFRDHEIFTSPVFP